MLDWKGPGLSGLMNALAAGEQEDDLFGDRDEPLSTHMEFIYEGEDLFLAEIDDETDEVLWKTPMPKPAGLAMG